MHSVPSRLPLHLVPKSFLQDVPTKVFHIEAPLLGAEPTSTTLRLRIGGWINLPLGHQQPVSLLLVCRNQEGEEEMLLVDEMNARGASEVLLSGEVELDVEGLASLAIYCGGIRDKSVWPSNLTVTASATLSASHNTQTNANAIANEQRKAS